MGLKTKCFFVLSIALMIYIIVIVHLLSRENSGVVGWDQNQSRNVRDYVNDSVMPIIFPTNFCIDKKILFVMIISKLDHFQARNTIRQTWAQKRDNVSFFFLLGRSKNNDLLQKKVQTESENYDDIIQERFVDHYNNLTLKSVHMLKLFHKYCLKSYKFLMKVDDDLFVNIAHVVKMLMQRMNATNLLLGKAVDNLTPFRDRKNKWYAPYKWYPEKKYPNYLCGPTYLMSSDVVSKLYRCALETPLFHIEDVYITGICAKKMNLSIQSDSHFRCVHVYAHFKSYKDLYAIHLYSYQDIRRSYYKLAKQS